MTAESAVKNSYGFYNNLDKKSSFEKGKNIKRLLEILSEIRIIAPIFKGMEDCFAKIPFLCLTKARFMIKIAVYFL